MSNHIHPIPFERGDNVILDYRNDGLSNWSGIITNVIIDYILENYYYELELDGIIVPNSAMDGSSVGPEGVSFHKAYHKDLIFRTPKKSDDLYRAIWRKKVRINDAKRELNNAELDFDYHKSMIVKCKNLRIGKEVSWYEYIWDSNGIVEDNSKIKMTGIIRYIDYNDFRCDIITPDEKIYFIYGNNFI